MIGMAATEPATCYLINLREAASPRLVRLGIPAQPDREAQNLNVRQLPEVCEKTNVFNRFLPQLSD
jgi:hypothetical protein